MYKASRGIFPRFMQNLVEEFDIKYHTRYRYDLELDEDGNVKSLRKAQSSFTKIQHKFIWNRIISMART